MATSGAAVFVLISKHRRGMERGTLRLHLHHATALAVAAQHACVPVVCAVLRRSTVVFVLYMYVLAGSVCRCTCSCTHTVRSCARKILGCEV
jgi:hypothetical protein